MAIEVAGVRRPSDRGAPAGRRVAMTWGIPAVIGITLAVLGVVAMLTAPIAGVATMMVLGVLLAATGIVEIVGAIRGAHQRRFWLTFLGGVLSLAAGVLVIAYPMRSLASTTLMLASFFVVAGLFRVITSMIDRYRDWVWDLGYGVLVALLGTWALSTWPISSLVVIGMLVGAELLVRGGAWLGAAIALRRALRSGTIAGAPGGLRTA